MQQLQRAAAGADKDVFGVNSLRFPALHILNRYVRVVGITFEIRYLRGGLQGEVVIFLQAADQLASDFAVVDIGTHRRRWLPLSAADRGLPSPAAPTV